MILPLRTRLTAIYCVTFCVGAAALEGAAYAALKWAVYAIADRDLKSRLAGVEEFLSDHITRVSLAKVQHELQTHTALQPDLLSVVEERGSTIFVAPALASYHTRVDGPDPGLWSAGTSSHPLRLLTARQTIGGVNYRLVLGSDLTVPFQVVGRFGLLLLISSPLLIASAAAIGHWTAGRALSPMVAITSAARMIDATGLNRRIELPPGKDELYYLAETLNGMLGRIDIGFRRTVEFTANASHELRTPLAVIRAAAEVALMRPVPNGPNPDREALLHILREAERTTTLLEDLLRLARADSGTARLNMAAVELNESVRSTCEVCEPLAAKRGLQLRFVGTAKPLCVSADRGCLKSLVLILVDNAIKYTPAGGSVQVTVSASGSEVVCEVWDTGIGISEADLEHIFERFYRSDRARNREEGGAGLGLSIAHWMVQVHGGSIEVKSELGTGSTFRVILPRLAQAGQRANPSGPRTAYSGARA